jgi:hypothetical protein
VAVDTQPLSSGLIVRRKGEGRGQDQVETAPDPVEQTTVQPQRSADPVEQVASSQAPQQPRRRQRGYVPPSVVERKALNVRIPLDVAEALREMANEQRITYQDLVTEMLEAGLHAWDENWKVEMDEKLKNRGL